MGWLSATLRALMPPPASRSPLRSKARTPNRPDWLTPRLCAALLCALFALVLLHAWISSCDHDEIVYLHAAWLVSEGARPFRDFVEHHHPTLYYLLAPITAAMAPNPVAAVFAGRLVNLFFIALTAATTAAILRPLTARAGRIAGVLLLAGCFCWLRNSLEVRPDTAMCLFAYLGLWQWLNYLRKGRWTSALASGFCYGLAIVFLQKAVLFVALVLVGTLIFALRSRAQSRNKGWLVLLARGSALCTLGAVFPLVFFVVSLARAGLLPDFYFWNYPFNQFYYLHSQATGGSAFGTLGFALVEDPVLWALGLWGACAAIRKLASRGPSELVSAPELPIALTVLFGTLVFLFRNPFPYPHNLLFALPALALLGAWQANRPRSPLWQSLWQVGLVLMVIKVGILCLVYEENTGHRKVQRWVLAHSAPSDLIDVPPPYHPIFRKDAYFFWYDGQRKAAPYAEYCQKVGCPVDRLTQDKSAPLPSLVYLSEDYPSPWPIDWERDGPRYRSTEIPGMFQLR